MSRNPPPTPYPGFNRPRTVVEDQRNGWAIASLISGIVGLLVPIVPGAFAIVAGVLGIRKTLDSRFGGQGKATAGICLGVISFALHGCIYTIVWPRFDRAAETANRVMCARNMRDIGKALLQYAQNNQGRFPDALEQTLLMTQGPTAANFVCPSSHETPAPGDTPAAQAQSLNSGGHLSYTYVGKGRRKGAGDAVLLYDASLGNHRNDGMNFLWEDGKVSWEPTETARRIVGDINTGHNPPRALR